MRTIPIKIFLFIIIISHYLNISAQEMYVFNLPLIMPELGNQTKSIPIYSYYDTLYVMTADGNWGVCSQKTDWWYTKFYDSSIRNTMEFIVSPNGGFFVFDHYRQVLMFDFPELRREERFCPGRPLFDQNERIHIIRQISSDTCIYYVSDDTLSSFVLVDTVLGLQDFKLLISNPDNTTIGAIFYDYQNYHMYEYLINNGFIDFDDPRTFQNFDYMGGIYDMILDFNDNIIAVVRSELVFPGNVYRYVWTEGFGFRYLSMGIDEIQEPIYFEITLNPADNEIILVTSEFRVNFPKTYFHYSPDNGISWYSSLFEIEDAFYGSSQRIFDDALDCVYYRQTGLAESTFYCPVPIDSITGNLSSVNEEEIIPEVISLFRSYPNPFNPPVTFEFNLVKYANAKIAIYAVNGARVETIGLFDLPPGRYSVGWDASDVCSGVYFARLEAGGESKSIKLVLLK